jgi:uncharacterized protein YdgA (DUF945 family)
MVSTLHLDDGNGNLTDLPGTIFSETDLSGETTGRYVLEPGSREDGRGVATWSGADLHYVANGARRSLSLKGEIGPWSYRSGQDSFDVGLLTLDARQTDSDFGFPVGEVQLEINSLAVAAATGPLSGFDRLKIDGTSSIAGDKLNARTQMSLEKLAIPEVGEVGLSFDAMVGGLDAASVGRISKAVNAAQGSGDPATALDNLFSTIEKDLESLLTAGGEVRFDKLNIALPQGEIRSQLGVKLADSAGSFSWPGVILALTASADLEVAAALVDLGRQSNPQAGSLVDLGFLKLDGDVYHMQAKFAGGLLTINGAPMPLPFPGQ